MSEGRASRLSGNTVRMSVTMPNALPVEGDATDPWWKILRQEIHLIFGFGSAIFFLIWGDHHKLAHELSTTVFLLCFAWIFVQCIWLAFAVVRHADCLAVQCGEPYGTLILTLSVISIEVIMMAALMISGDEPRLARDTMFAVVMIVLNGMLGVTLILGGFRHRQQAYNLQSAQTFINVLLPLALLSLIVPRFTRSAPDGEVSDFHAVFLVFQSVVLYCVFLGVQTMRHPDFFMFTRRQHAAASPAAEAVLPDVTDLEASHATLALWDAQYPQQEPASPSAADSERTVAQGLREVATANTRLTRQVSVLTRQLLQLRQQSQQSLISLDGFNNSPEQSPAASPSNRLIPPPAVPGDQPASEAGSHEGLVVRSVPFHAALLILSMVPISLLAEKLAALVERVVDDLGAPNALAGFFVAVIVLSPEAMGAARAAMHNKVQRTVNISLGSALSTIGLTVPAVMTIHLITGKRVILGLDLVQCTELLITMLVTMVTFSGAHTNVLHGVVHMVLFLSYVMLMFDDKSEDGSPAASPTS